ncbi:hypothetical protein AXG93_2587s1040 [Marchantia polymorpha subsp. ruderalis]|uniref:Uncharacterized protein n=1 Tax=Marchantia polymorpha subsp. ruderalis TaxID=1480154 RepID=A0A176WQK8_MARPO|nr:hypothetical protein AXG93_2587s1040 [Marchantia polymorpha subsp. ruderalis]
MSPRSPENRSAKEHAFEEEDEERYVDHEASQDDLITDKYVKETVSAEEPMPSETSPRPPSPFEGFLEEVPDTQSSFPAKIVTARAFEDRLFIIDKRDEAFIDENEVREFKDSEISPHDRSSQESKVPDPTGKIDSAVQVQVLAFEAIESEEKSNSPDISITVENLVQGILAEIAYSCVPPAVINPTSVYSTNISYPSYGFDVLAFLILELLAYSCMLGGHRFGYYTAAAFLVVPTVRSLTDNTIMQIMFRLGMNVDTEKVNGASPFLQTTWSAIVQVIGNIALLLYYMGWSAMVGIGLLLLTIPMQGKVVQNMMLIQKVILKNTGRRVKVVNEVLQGIRVVKAYAWEEPFNATINGVRALELKSMRRRVFLRALQTCLMLATPVLIMVVSFSIYAGVQKKDMTAATVFTCLSLFNSLRQPLMMYPFVINGVISGYVSLNRLSRFMQSEEMHPIPRGPITGDKPVLHMENSTFQWVSGSIGGFGRPSPDAYSPVMEDESKDTTSVGTSKSGVYQKKLDPEVTPRPEKFSLRNISLTVNRGQLVAIVGPVGSGKSSLAAAFLGEMQQISGENFTANGTLAYCAQQAWIMNASLKDNILFGLEYDEGRYRAVLSACALDQVNVPFQQSMSLRFPNPVPAFRTSTYLDLVNLPDGDQTEIGERGINLSGGQKQRVSLARAVYADMDVYLLDDPLSAVDAHVGAHLFSKCITGFLSDKTRIFITNQLQYVPSVDHIMVLEEGAVAEQGAFEDLVLQDGEFSRLMKESGIQKGEEETEEETSDTMSPLCWGGGERKRIFGILKFKTAKLMPIFIQTLRRTKYRARASTYSGKVFKNYWTEASWIMPLFVLALYCAVQCVDAFNRYWLAYWTNNHFRQSTAFYLGIYAALGVFFAGLLYSRMLSQLMLGLWTAKKLHESVLDSIMHAPMSFFDTTPVGRILNRFSADQQTVDETLPFSWVSFLNILFQVYRRTARELKRLGSLSISPVYQQFTETLNGLATIRAYQQEDRFMEMCAGKLNVTNRAYMLLQSCNRWLSVRLEFMGNLMVFAAALLAVSKKGTLYAGYAGISIDYAMQITASLNMLVALPSGQRQAGDIETHKQFRPDLGPITPSQITPPQDWPTEGAIEFETLEMRYRPGLPLVLKGVSMSINGGEVVGVVGRTGSGKSSLMLCLFRLVEPASGRIKIDGIDIGNITLKNLRSRLSIIPQEPILFSGTVRTNIDPFSAHSDDEIWKVLERSHLKDKVGLSPNTSPKRVTELPGKLDADVAEYGENFSVGERQLLCLARVLLRSCKILIMDEATSSVDFETDKLIQGTIRTHLRGTTMLIIAHRINTVIDASRVLVLSQGKVVEYDTPAALLDRPQGIFSTLVQVNHFTFSSATCFFSHFKDYQEAKYHST